MPKPQEEAVDEGKKDEFEDLEEKPKDGEGEGEEKDDEKDGEGAAGEGEGDGEGGKKDEGDDVEALKKKNEDTEKKLVREAKKRRDLEIALKESRRKRKEDAAAGGKNDEEEETEDEEKDEETATDATSVEKIVDQRLQDRESKAYNEKVVGAIKARVKYRDEAKAIKEIVAGLPKSGDPEADVEAAIAYLDTINRRKGQVNTTSMSAGVATDGGAGRTQVPKTTVEMGKNFGHSAKDLAKANDPIKF